MSEHFHERLVDPAKAAFAAAVFTAAVTLSGCGSATGSDPACQPQPSQSQLDSMSDSKLRECLEAADREGHSSYSIYYGHYYGRGFGYTRGTYSAAPATSGGSAFRGSSGSSSGGSSYKSGGGGSFSGGHSSGSSSAGG